MLRSKNLNFIQYSRALLNENKWRASRYGVDGHLIDFGKEEEVNTRALLYELLDFLDPVLDHLGSRHRVAYIHKMLENGTGADRQLAVFEHSKNLTDVARYINHQYLAGI
jgi:carboxylate-amine ligase